MIVHVVAQMFDLFRDKRSLWRLMDTAFNFDRRVAPCPGQRVQSIKRRPVEIQDGARPQLERSLMVLNR
jgi:hypothetical protein